MADLPAEVSLIEVPEAFIDQYDLHLTATETALIEGWVHVQGGQAGARVEVEIPELHAKTEADSDDTGRAPVHLNVQGLERWSPEIRNFTKLRFVRLLILSRTCLGFARLRCAAPRSCSTASLSFCVVFPIHAEAPYRTGRAYSDKDAETLLGWAKELGCNFVRLAHYPHAETMLRAADREGILVWSENPVYWALQFENAKVLAKAEQQLDEEIGTSRNHAVHHSLVDGQ